MKNTLRYYFFSRKQKQAMSNCGELDMVEVKTPRGYVEYTERTENSVPDGKWDDYRLVYKGKNADLRINGIEQQ